MHFLIRRDGEKEWKNYQSWTHLHWPVQVTRNQKSKKSCNSQTQLKNNQHLHRKIVQRMKLRKHRKKNRLRMMNLIIKRCLKKCRNNMMKLHQNLKLHRKQTSTPMFRELKQKFRHRMQSIICLGMLYHNERMVNNYGKITYTC